MSLKCWFWAFKDAGGSWLWFGILNFDLYMFIVLWYTPVLKFGFLSGFWWCRDNLVIEVLIWGLGGCCRFLILVWYLDLDWIWSLVLGRPVFQILALYLDFQGAKTSIVPKSPKSGLKGHGCSLHISKSRSRCKTLVRNPQSLQKTQIGTQRTWMFLHLENQDIEQNLEHGST